MRIEVILGPAMMNLGFWIWDWTYVCASVSQLYFRRDVTIDFAEGNEIASAFHEAHRLR